MSPSRWSRLWAPSPRAYQRWISGEPSESLVRVLGLLGICAAVVGAITYPLVAVSGDPALAGLVLLAAAGAGLVLTVLPGRWLTPPVAMVTVVSGIALQTLFAGLTGGVSSPYRAGFVAVVLLVAFFARPTLAVAAAMLGIAGMVVAGALHGGLTSAEVAAVFTAGLLTLMVALTAGQLAAWQRDEERRLRRRVDRARRVAQIRRAESLADPLTGAGNRRRFESDLLELLRAAHSDPRGVLLAADVDGLKRINDSFGHPMGDRAIVAVADALRGVLRRDDRLYRIGGDEFAVLFPGVGVATVEGRLRAHLQVEVPGVGDVRASLGLAEVRGGDLVADVVRRADEQLYEAKQHRARTPRSGAAP